MVLSAICKKRARVRFFEDDPNSTSLKNEYNLNTKSHKITRVCFSRLHEKTCYYTVLASDEPGGKRNRTLICTITYRTLYLLYCTKRNIIVHYIYYTVLSNIHEKNICRIRVTHARNTCERSLFAHLNNTTIQSKF